GFGRLAASLRRLTRWANLVPRVSPAPNVGGLDMRGLCNSLASLLVLSGALFATREARACGGTFCDSGPTAMPVDQTGENVLFVLDGTNVEAHVQIQYQGAASRF